MSSPQTVEVLNRVLAILQRSFPQYLRYARPYSPSGRPDVMETINQIAAEQDALADRVSRAIFDAGGRPDTGRFPIQFTDLHDLGLDFLVQASFAYQQQDIADLEHCADAVRDAPAAHKLAAEALDLAHRHLQSLESLAQKTTPSTTVRNGAPAFDNE